MCIACLPQASAKGLALICKGVYLESILVDWKSYDPVFGGSREDYHPLCPDL